MNPTATDHSLLSEPQVLPLCSIKEIISESVLVVAPHPDDETLGCGGAIALLCAFGKTVKILVISDGTQSHPNSIAYPALALKKLREAETRSAMDMLGVKNADITFFQLPDGSAAIPNSKS